MLSGKKIILGITGSIAAYKSIFLLRLLRQAGAEVKVILTHGARDFVTPLTLSTLSEQPVLTESFDKVSGEWYNHVELGVWADAIVIAPASANTLAKMANGISDNLLLNTYLSARCQVFAAPAMDLDMFSHPTTVSNIARIEQHGVKIIDATAGALASGLEGKGRMEEPEEILRVLNDFFAENEALKGKKIMITAGPTYEAIDPVRFIGNHSSGKMGIALASEAARMGAQVTLVIGPTHEPVPDNILVERITTAREMLEKCEYYHQHMDVVIFSAAVADYRPANPSDQKIKKKEESMSVSLTRNPDIAATLGQRKRKLQLHIGFALETEKGKEHAVSKLHKKNLDMIVLNVLGEDGAGFGYDTNKITILKKDGVEIPFQLTSKKTAAKNIMDEVVKLIID